MTFRGDAAFAKPQSDQALEELDVKYPIRLPANDNLQRNIRELLTRPMARAEQCKQAVKMTRLSCHRFRSNEVRLWLSLIVYNLGNLWRRLVLPAPIGKWSLTSLQQRLVKTGGRLIQHARYYLVAIGREPSDPAAVRGHAAENRRLAHASGI